MLCWRLLVHIPYKFILQMGRIPVDRWRCVYRADNYVEGYSGAYSVEYYYGVLCTEYGVQSSSTPIRDPTEGRNYKKNRIREIKHRAAIRIG